jgi:hypothetical protein
VPPTPAPPVSPTVIVVIDVEEVGECSQGIKLVTASCATNFEGLQLAWTVEGACSVKAESDTTGGEVAIVLGGLSAEVSEQCKISCTALDKLNNVEITTSESIPGCKECIDSNGCNLRDRCGVCGGDGTSCASCTSTDNSGAIIAVDSRAKNQADNIKQLTKRLSALEKRRGRSKAAIKNAQIWASEAAVLYSSTWMLVWSSVKHMAKDCSIQGIQSECTTTSNTKAIAEIGENNRRLVVIARKVLRALRAAGLPRATLTRLMRENVALFNASLAAIESLPKEGRDCTPVVEERVTCS